MASAPTNTEAKEIERGRESGAQFSGERWRERLAPIARPQAPSPATLQPPLGLATAQITASLAEPASRR
jgi:hypothetical protein